MIDVNTTSGWVVAGLVGQALFGARFLVQWIHSEKVGKSRFPSIFWQISVVAGAIILAYAIHRRDPVFIIGETTTLLVFLRNLQMLSRKPPMENPSPADTGLDDNGRGAL
ncbi:hypothetical protein DVT68_14785 [Dyella solisilvae]|uniref:Lipid A biosynthesis N-terminal domain-containing protein n=1 Tax=Dyella solisilvae TaxID=1920168 RepID=A0A370K6B2_9GAMM|nr:lipid-A-disaccharide synthase N-terminal domain-containing protein [Dyella solisilvae]RDI97560.1 hypothetical protein DVT68_14785 [Dyella solisilvae]